jgi:hypothetical protein
MAREEYGGTNKNGTTSRNLKVISVESGCRLFCYHKWSYERGSRWQLTKSPYPLLAYYNAAVLRSNPTVMYMISNVSPNHKETDPRLLKTIT